MSISYPTGDSIEVLVCGRHWWMSVSYPTGDSVQVLVGSRCQLYPSKGYIKAMLSQGPWA